MYKKHLYLIGVLLIISTITIVSTYIYYASEQSSADPRVIPAREYYEAYNQYAQANKLSTVLELLDSAEAIYQSVPHYKESFEIAVLDNNRAAVFLTLALFRDSIEMQHIPPNYKDLSFDSLLNISEVYAVKAMHIYQKWAEQYATLQEDSIEILLLAHFDEGLEKFSPQQKEAFRATRIKEILTAQVEIDRRISVALTNLAVIYRHREQYEKAAEYNLQALELWSENIQAENNLNVLLNRPQRQRNFIEKILPPNKNK